MTSRTLAHPFGLRHDVAWPRVQDYLRHHGAALFSVLAGAGLLMSAVLWVTGARGAWLGFLIGAFIATLSCSIAWLGAEARGARVPLIGAMGEAWTADALKGLRRRWVRVDDVLLSNAGVFAVHTEFTASEWSLSSPALRSAMREARATARKIQLLFDRSGHPSVTPVLVIWGPGAPAIPGGSTVIDDVVVCRGQSAKEWRGYFEGLEPTLDSASVVECVAAVRDRTIRTERADRRASASS